MALAYSDYFHSKYWPDVALDKKTAALKAEKACTEIGYCPLSGLSLFGI
jgi:hypothetical protein